MIKTRSIYSVNVELIAADEMEQRSKYNAHVEELMRSELQVIPIITISRHNQTHLARSVPECERRKM